MKHTLIGLSLSLCVKDIIDGKFAKEDVQKIIANTAMVNDKDIESIISSYQKKYWQSNPELGADIVTWLIWHKKLEQPRVDKTLSTHPGILSGHWMLIYENNTIFYSFGEIAKDKQ